MTSLKKSALFAVSPIQFLTNSSLRFMRGFVGCLMLAMMAWGQIADYTREYSSNGTFIYSASSAAPVQIEIYAIGGGGGGQGGSYSKNEVRCYNWGYGGRGGGGAASYIKYKEVTNSVLYKIEVDNIGGVGGKAVSKNHGLTIFNPGSCNSEESGEGGYDGGGTRVYYSDNTTILRAAGGKGAKLGIGGAGGTANNEWLPNLGKLSVSGESGGKGAWRTSVEGGYNTSGGSSGKLYIGSISPFGGDANAYYGYGGEGGYGYGNNSVGGSIDGKSGRSGYVKIVATKLHTITFNSNGGSSVSSITDILNGSAKNVYGTTFTAPTPTKAGYIFDGWYTSLIGGTKWNFSNAVTASMTLYARWVPAPYSITYNTNGGEFAGSGTQTGTVSITVQMRDSYGDGWNSAALRINVNGTDISSTTRIASGSNGIYSFTVNRGDQVKFYWAKGSYDYECAFAAYYTTALLNPAFNPASGASNDPSILLSKQYNDLSSISTGTLLGSFTAGGGSASPTTFYTIESPTVTLLSPTRTDYRFVGWYTNSALTGTKVVSIPIGSIGDKMYYAKWEQIPRPQSLNAVFGQWDRDGGKVTLNWTYSNSNNLQGNFWIYRRMGTSGNWSRLGSVTAASNLMQYIDATTSYSVNYQYAVIYQESGTPASTLTAMPANADSPAIRSAIMSGTVSTIPTLNWNVTALPGETQGTINVSFTADTRLNKGQQYTIDSSSKIENGAWSDWGEIKNADLNGLVSYESLFSGLNVNRDYRFRVTVPLYSFNFIQTSAETKPKSILTNYRASKGEYNNRVRLEWTNVESNPTETYRVSRRTYNNVDSLAGPWVALEMVTNSSGIDTTTTYWNDNNALIGIFYQYKVELIRSGAIFATVMDIGFVQATGSVSGRVTYGSGIAVDSVDIFARRDPSDLQNGEVQYRSLKSDGGGQMFEWKSEFPSKFNNIWASKKWALQFWVNPDSSNTGTTVIGYIGAQEIKMDKDELTGGYKIYTQMNTAQTVSSTIIPANRFSHITITRNADIVKIYSIVDKNILVSSNALTTLVTETSQNPARISFGYSLKGNIDEVRFWNLVLDSTKIIRDYSRVLVGNEQGLQGYWTFDDGLDKHAFDISRDGTVYNSNHATTNLLAFDSEIIPDEEQLAIKGTTDASGNYQIRGIPYYGEGTSYLIVPSMGIHEFNPRHHLRYISPTSMVHNGTDFTDISSFTVSGYIKYANSNYPVEGVSISVDGLIAVRDGEPIVTDARGFYYVDVPIGEHFITVSKQGHIFESNGRFPANVNVKHNFQSQINDLNFVDSTTVRLAGRVVGGQIESDKVLGFGLSNANIGQATIILNTENNIYSINTTPSDFTNISKIGEKNSETTFKQGSNVIEIKTNSETGEFAADLPPVPYILVGIKTYDFDDTFTDDDEVDFSYSKTRFDMNPNSEHKATYIDSTNKEIEYIFNDSLKITRYNDPIITLIDKGAELGAFGDSIYVYTDKVTGNKDTLQLYAMNNNAPQYTLGVPVFSQKKLGYTWQINAYEEYINNDNETKSDTVRVPLDSAQITISNALASERLYVDDDDLELSRDESNTTLILDENGMRDYSFKVSFPNMAGNHQLAAKFSLNKNGKAFAKEVSGILLGQMPSSGTNFVTKGPDKVDIVLRDPPGSNSYAYIEKGSSYTYTKLNTDEFTEFGDVKATLHTGAKQAVGVGFGVFAIVETEISNDLTVGGGFENVRIGNNEIQTTVLFNEQIETSSDPDYVGSMADVYIGRSSNLTFGMNNQLAIYPNSDVPEGLTPVYKLGADYSLFAKQVLTKSEDYNTMFSLSQTNLVKTQIPNTKKLRNQLIKTVDVMPRDQSMINFGEDKVVYLSELPASDSDFGKEGTYTVFYSPNATEAERIINEVRDYNIWINNWELRIADNEKDKVELFEKRMYFESTVESNANDAYWKNSRFFENLSFDAGVSIEKSLEVNYDNVYVEAFFHTEGIYIEDKLGVKFGGLGLISEGKYGGKEKTGNTTTKNDGNSMKFGYKLSEGGSGNDAFSVDVYGPMDDDMIAHFKDGKPITSLTGFTFHTRAGQSSCPYEAPDSTLYYKDTIADKKFQLNYGTLKIENPEIYIDNKKVATAENISSGREATFSLHLQNLSEAALDVTYLLSVEPTSNPDGLIITMDGEPLIVGRQIRIKYDNEATKKIKIRQSNLDILDYKDIEIRLSSVCDPSNYASATIGIEFTPASSPVTLTANTTTVNASSNRGDTIAFTISEYERAFRNFGMIRLQYRSATSETWYSIQEFVNDPLLYSLTDDRKSITSNIINHDYAFNNLAADGEYYFRALAVSKIGTEEITTTSEEILITKDVSLPRALGLPSPASGIMGIGDELSITFNEDIQTGLLTQNNFSISGVLNAQEISEPSAGIAFTGGSQYAKTELPIYTGGSFSIEGWFKHNTGNAGTLFAFGNTNNSSISLGFDASGKAVLKVGNETYSSTASIANDETWKYIAMTYNHENNSVSVYEFEGTTSRILIPEKILTSSPPTQGQLIVGNNISNSSGFTGAISRLHFYGTKRTEADVSASKSLSKSGREQGLIGYWALDEAEGTVAVDKARARNLALNSADWYVYPSGYAKRTNDNYFSIPTADYPLNASSDFTLEFWFRSENTTQRDQTLFSNDHGYIAINASGGLTLYKNGGTENRVLTTANLINTKWHHVAISVRRGGNANVYINGISMATFPETLLGTFASGYYYFGVKRIPPNAFGNYFKGYFDEIRIWNSALTRESIALNKNSKLHGNEAGLLAYYPFEAYTKQLNGLISVTQIDTSITDGNSVTGATIINIAVPMKDVRPVENVPFSYVASNNKIVFTLDPSYFARVEGTTLTIAVKDVRDMRDNKSNTEQWTAFIRRNALQWDNESIHLSINEGESGSFKAKITNVGASTVSYTIENMPQWLSVENGIGNLPPMASKELKFNVAPGVNIGSYEAVIGLASGNGITENLNVQLKVSGKNPGWIANPSDFEGSMSIIGQIKIDGILSENTENVLTAFIGEQCVGIASLTYVSPIDAYFVFANIYGNAEHNNQPITFKLWDASTGRIYPKVETSINNIRYASTTVLGSPSVPVEFNASDVYEQVITLKKGWNWISSNLLSENPSILDQAKYSLGNAGVIIKGQNSYIQQQLSWIGTLNGIFEKNMYLVNVNRDISLPLQGNYADPATSIDIYKGWNWIGYVPQFSLSVKNALAGINAKSGDIIKGQSSYAVYLGAGGWAGTLTYMLPGKGYMYYSGNMAQQTLIYPSQISQEDASQKAILMAAPQIIVDPVDPHWTVNSNEFPSSMTVTSIVVSGGEEIRSNQIEIGAFNGEECRGSTLLQYVPSENKYIGFLVVYGESNEEVNLKIYDHAEGEEYDANNEPLSFNADAIYGTPDFYVIRIGSDDNSSSSSNDTELSSSSSAEEPESSSSSSSIIEQSSSSDAETPTILPQIATSNLVKPIYNGINLQVTNNAVVEIFTLKGNLISIQNFSRGAYTVSFEHLSNGFYLVKAKFGSEKQILRVPVR